MKGKLAVAAVVVLAAILIASPVLALGSGDPTLAANPAPKKQPTIISLTGTVLTDSVYATTDTGKFEVAIQMTNRAFIQYRGEVEWVKITADTLCVEWVSTKKSVRIDCATVDRTDKVSINARVDPQTKEFTARRVTLYQPRLP